MLLPSLYVISLAPFLRMHRQPSLTRICLQEVPSDHTPSHVSLLHSVAGPSQGNPNIGHPENSGMSVAEDLEDLRVASRCLHKPGSRVDKVRVRRRDSGAVRELILLKIDDTM